MKKLWGKIKERYRQHLRKILRWAFAEELKEISDIEYMLGGRVQLSADIHQNTDSWAVISIKGKDRDYVKFINLGHKQMVEIAQFLRQYENVAVDANPMHVRYLREGYWL